MHPFKSILIVFTVFFWNTASADINQYFSSIKSDPNALYAFLKAMPKGGELHYHLAGGAYPETMLALARQGNYCLNPDTSIISKGADSCHGINIAKTSIQPEIYHQVIRAWSMKDFTPGQESRHDHFFASFFKFMTLVSDFRPQLLAEIMTRAADQHELYLEIMVLPDNAKSATFAKLTNEKASWTDKRNTLLADKDFQKNIQFTASESKRIIEQARQELGCNTSSKPAACDLTIKFQYFILREQPLENIFAQALNGFAAAALSEELVGVNLVQAEDGKIALNDYQAQMKIFKFLHQLYPTVHIALHAGELAPTAVTPEDLRFHIHDAIFTGHAERIGHGVDIAHENNAEALLAHMAKTPIVVETNLTSNHEILNISGKAHPLRYYLAHQVPVVLSTDDEGVLRTDLTRQYVTAAFEHGLDYPSLKAINRNALTYSFLPGKSLWADGKTFVPVANCQDFKSTACQQFMKTSQKAKLQVQLEQQLSAFENSVR